MPALDKQRIVFECEIMDSDLDFQHKHIFDCSKGVIYTLKDGIVTEK